MRSILIGAMAFTLPVYAMTRAHTQTDEENVHIKNKYYFEHPKQQKLDEEPDPDLFKRNAQVYSSHVEMLVWGIVEGGLDYGLKMRQQAWGPTPAYAQGRFETATYDFDPGVRIGFQYFRAPHFWEVKWQYTRLTNTGNNQSKKSASDQKFLTGTWPQIVPGPLAEIKSHLHFNYNVFDWMATRVFFPNPHLRLRVIGGMFGTWMDQEWKLHYNDALPRTTTITNRWHYVGGGLKIGTMLDWYWTGELYLTGSGTFGLAMGQYSNHSKQKTSYQPDPADDTSVPIRNAGYHDIRPTMTMQMLLGPSWQKNLPTKRFELFAGFEMNLWFNLQEIYRSTAGTPTQAKETWINSSLMALYGLTTRLSIDY